MKIAYVAKHNSGGNDDEGAIGWALEQLGCEVQRFSEHDYNGTEFADCDFVLFHKWEASRTLKRTSVPKVFWYFDLVNYADPTVQRRCETRMEWMRRTIPLIHLAFCTDGDWVEQDTSGKLRWLPQGFDSRQSAAVCCRPEPTVPLLFTGGQKGGQDRWSQIQLLKERYGSRFTHITSGCYGPELAKVIAGHRCVIAPESPTTDLYWSNRVYNALGFGAYLLHPYCERLAGQYVDGKEIRFYRSREEAYHLIDTYSHEVAAPIQHRAIEATLTHHTYMVRCRTLLATILEELF